MTRRLSALLLFIILAGLLAPAGFVRAQTDYYALSFDGVDDYASVPNPLAGATSYTVVIILNDDNVSVGDYLSGMPYTYVPSWGTNAVYFVSKNGEATVIASKTEVEGRTVMLAGVQDYDAAANQSTVKTYLNGVLGYSRTFTGPPDTTGALKLMNGVHGAQDGKIYLVLIYNRALSDSEIQQIYNDPLHPPTSGLVLEYLPNSVDPATNTWKDLSGNGNNGSIVGATPERVSIPSASYYDIENNSEIPVENVSVSMLANNTTTSLIPSFLTLPYNTTVTLNVSAAGYKSRTLSILTTINSLAVYLVPLSSNGTTTPPNWTNNFTMPDINGTGWSGWQIGKEALSMNFDKAIQMFFTENPNSKAQVFLPFAIWLGMTLLGLVFSRTPLVALTLGVVTQASLAGLGAKVDMRLLPGVVTLYLFLFIWTLKDFIESKKAD